MSTSNEKCINPWFGFFFIVLVCIMIAAAIFFESESTRQARKARQKGARNPVTQVNFYNPMSNDTASDKLIF